MSEKTFSQIVVNYWNDLPSAVVSTPTLDSFKRRLRSFEKHIFLSQTDLTRTGIISNSYNEMFEA
jgi:hypothetical protein